MLATTMLSPAASSTARASTSRRHEGSSTVGNSAASSDTVLVAMVTGKSSSGIVDVGDVDTLDRAWPRYAIMPSYDRYAGWTVPHQDKPTRVPSP
eukprot:1344068-Prymnesium_polylepis.1